MKDKILFIFFSALLFTAGFLYLFSPGENRPASSPPEIESLAIEPEEFRDGRHLYKEGAELVLKTKNTIRKEILFAPKGMEVAGFERVIFSDELQDNEVRFPITEKYLLGGMRARVVGEDGSTIESDYISIAYDDSDEIQIETPQPNETINTPLKVKGRARDFWFFESSISVTLLDANLRVLAKVPLEAKSEAGDFFEFEGEIPFTAPTTETGFLMIESDNPENPHSATVPIKFSDNETGAKYNSAIGKT